jgi:hypothetical protein
MAEPENQTLRILRDIRTAIKTLDQKNDKRFDTVDNEMATLRSRLDNLRQAMSGESTLYHRGIR